MRDECEFGRSYEPFVRDCEYGYYQANYHYHNGDLTGDYVHYRIAGDTLINGKAYKNISLTGECPDWERIPPAEQIREENRKVYFRYKEEEMGYDFNLTKGDGIILSDVHHALDTDINITVYDVKTVEFAGKERKCIYFKNSYGYYTGYWMEGIGDMNQGTLWTFDDHEGCPYPDIPCDEYTHILYYLRENGEYIYLQDNHIDTRSEAGGGNNHLARFTVEVFAPHQAAGSVDEFGQAVAVARQGHDQGIGRAGDAQGGYASLAHGQYTVAVVQRCPVVVVL